MNRSRGNDHTLPRPEPQCPTVGQVDLEPAFHDQKELIGARMLMPRVVPSEHRQAQAAGVDLADDLVTVRVAHGSCFTREVYHHERWKAHGFASVGFRRGDLMRHWRPLLRTNGWVSPRRIRLPLILPCPSCR